LDRTSAFPFLPFHLRFATAIVAHEFDHAGDRNFSARQAKSPEITSAFGDLVVTGIRFWNEEKTYDQDRTYAGACYRDRNIRRIR
jgi:hypothetical protein